MTRIENSKVPLTNLAAFLPTDIHKTKNFNGVNREISGRTKRRIIKRFTFLSLSQQLVYNESTNNLQASLLPEYQLKILDNIFIFGQKLIRVNL